MKLEIDIDEKEFGHDIADHFQDFFKRLQAEIKTRLISDDTLVCGAYELETIDMFLTAFKNATLEQEPKFDVLDKIRAEINTPVIHDEYSQRQNDYCDGYEFICSRIKEIIGDAESDEYMTDKNLCDSCTNTGCMFQSGIVRTKCDFYKPRESEE